MQVLCGLQGLFLLFNCQTSDNEVFAVFPGDWDGYDSEYFAASGVYRGELF